jgi:hypothetical protein
MSAQEGEKDIFLPTLYNTTRAYFFFSSYSNFDKETCTYVKRVVFKIRRQSWHWRVDCERTTGLQLW